MHMSEREERFEKMLNNVLKNYENTVLKLEKLKAEDKIEKVNLKMQVFANLKNVGFSCHLQRYGRL